MLHFKAGGQLTGSLNRYTGELLKKRSPHRARRVGDHRVGLLSGLSEQQNIMLRVHGGEGPVTLGMAGSKLKGGEDQGPNILFKGTQESSKVLSIGPISKVPPLPAAPQTGELSIQHACL